MWKVCCFFDLRTGCIIIAVLQIVGSLSMLGGTSAYQASSAAQACWSGLVGVVAGICLLIGVNKPNASAILVYLFLAMIDIILYGVVGIVLCAGSFAAADGSLPGSLAHDSLVDPNAHSLLAWGICIILMALSGIYFWVCVYRFYQLTRYGKITSCAQI